MTKEQIDQMVNAFLCWKIPQTFNPDCHISFAPKPDYHGNPPTWPVGTNLFSYTEAKAMVEHMVAALTPPPTPDAVALVDAVEETLCEYQVADEGDLAPRRAYHAARAAVLARMDRRAVFEACARVAETNELTGTPDGLTVGEAQVGRIMHRATKDEIAKAIRALADKETGNG